MKKLSILILTFILLFSSAGNVMTAFSPETLTPTDINGHWAEDSIQTLKELGVMNGFDGVINPDSIITRGEFTALITRAFGLKADPMTENFTDIGADHMFFENICAASQAGIIDGFPDSTFRPGNMITREEIMLIISRIRTGENNHRASFTDIDPSYEYFSQLSKISGDGIISGYPDGTFRPYGRTTRAEAASMVLSAMKKYMAQADTNAISALTAEYMPAHFSNDYAVDKFLTGEADTDRKYIDYTYEYSKEKGYVVKNSVYGLDITSVEHYGPFSIVKAEYRVTNSVNGSANDYKGKSEIGIITRNGESKVYKHHTEIVFEQKINLTWELMEVLSQSEAPGINVVSPTCFVVSPQIESNDVVNLGSDAKGSMYFNSSLTQEYVSNAKAKNYDIWAMYKSDFTTDTANRFLNNTSLRMQSINRLMEKILYFDLDGINFDFENMLPTDRGAYTNHVKEIGLMAHTLGVVTSVDVTKYSPYSANWSMCFDRDSLARYADYIVLMAYDQHYAGSKTPGPVAGFEWTINAINLTLNEVSPEKVVLGMPYYIRYWEVKNGKTVSSKAVSMATAIEYVTQNNASSSYDSEHQMTKYSWIKGGRECMLWMENADTIRRRAQLANHFGLAGVASWRRGFETSDVWQAIEAELK